MADSTLPDLTPAVPSTTGDPRFPQFQITPPPLPLDVVDNVARAVFDPNAGKMTYFGYAVVLARMTFFFVYLAVRKMLVDQMMMAAKQKYEQNQVGDAQNVIDKDNLDGVKRVVPSAVLPPEKL